MPFDEVFERYLDGVASYESGRSKTALYILEDALVKAENYHTNNKKYHPNHRQILELLLACYKGSKESEEDADKVISKAIKIDSKNLRTLNRAFNYYESLHEEKIALAIYSRAEKIVEKAKLRHKDIAIYKLFEQKGKTLKMKRETDSILNKPNIDKQGMMKQLPLELIYLIMSKLDEHSLRTMLLICKGWRSTILESPLLIGAYQIQGILTTNKLERYLRLFDQKVSTANIMVQSLTLQPERVAFESNLLKILFTSRLRAKSMKLGGDTNLLLAIPKMIREKKTAIFSDLIDLTIQLSRTEASWVSIHSILGQTKRLRSLSLEMNTSYLMDGTFVPVVPLPGLQTLSIRVRMSSFPGLEQLLNHLEYPNLQNLIWSASDISPLEIVLSKDCHLKSLKLNYISANSLLLSFFNANSNLFNKIKSIEKLEIADTSQHFDASANSTALINLKVVTFPRLKTLIFQNSHISSLQFEIFLDACKNTLKKLVISESLEDLLVDRQLPLMGSTPRIRRSSFNIVYILETLPKLNSFQFKAREMSVQGFTKSMHLIATMKKSVKLNFFEISGHRILPSEHVIQFMAIKDKIFVNHLRIECSLDATLETFAQMLLQSGQVKCIESVRDSKLLVNTTEI